MPLENDQAEQLESGFARNIHRVRLSFLAQEVHRLTHNGGGPSAGIVVDIGCGDGVLTREIATQCTPAARVVGVELDASRLARARQRCPSTTFVRGQGTHLPLADGSCHGLVLHHVIEHIPGDREVLQECARVLQEDGWLILGIPQEGGPVGRCLRRLHPGLYARGGHINFYTINSMRRMLTDVGFEVEGLATFGLLFPFYYLHLLLIWHPWTFHLGHRLARRYRGLADSLTFVARKRSR